MNLFGLEIKPLNYDILFNQITTTSKRKIKIFTPNPEIMLRVKDDEEFKDTLKQANYLTSDGVGLFIAYEILSSHNSKILDFVMIPYYIIKMLFNRSYFYRKFGERICGSDLTRDLLNYYNTKSGSVAIIDPYYPQDKNKVESQRTLTQKLEKLYPNLKIKLHVLSKDKEEIRKEVTEDKPDLLLVTTGMKTQEEMVNYILEEADVKIAMGIGSSIDYLIGFQKRAPEIFRKFGLEWLYRLVTGPQKLKRINRIYQALVVFLITVALSK